jgi:hypothetical protein
MKGQSQFKQLLTEFINIMGETHVTNLGNYIAIQNKDLEKLANLLERVEKCLSAE